MSPIPINLATEDELSEAVLSRLLSDARRFAIGRRYRRGGNGYLKSTIAGWNRAATGIPFLVLTDLDTHHCPSELIASWLAAPQHPNLVFRIAVREVESWLLADRTNFAELPWHPGNTDPCETGGTARPEANSGSTGPQIPAQGASRRYRPSPGQHCQTRA